jgi:RNA polymerase sigma-70 factor (ECF subfamily)
MDAAAAYRELARPVLGFLRARGVADPEDVLGEVFLQVARDLDRFREREDPEAVRRWVFTIARNRAIDEGRRRRRRPRVVTAEVPEAGRSDAGGPDPTLLAAIATLTDDQREVIGLRFVADLALADVARITGRTTEATKALQHRALESLRKAVSPEPPPTL